MLFWDTIIRESIPDCYADEGFVTVSTNPCGEIPLCPYDSCRLLAMNLLSYVDNPFKADAKFNFDKFRDHVYKAMHMMDDIIDLELEKVELIIEKIAADPEDMDVRRVELELWKKIREMARKGRRTGLGITAEGDMLAALGLRYGTQGGDRLRRRGAEVPCPGGLRRFGEDGRRARCLPGLRRCEGGEQPDDRPHP